MTDMLTHITAEAETKGADLILIRALIEEASDEGARRALARLGLQDDKASRDMAELRELLGAWRDAKTSARKAAIGWVVRLSLALLLIGIAVKLNLMGLVVK
jgi:Family of unknown function (DUF6127)